MFPLLVPFVEIRQGDPASYSIHRAVCKRFLENSLVAVEVIFDNSNKLFHRNTRFFAQHAEFVLVDEEANTNIAVGISLAIEQDELLDYEPLFCKTYPGYVLAYFAPYGWTSSPHEIIYDSNDTNTCADNSIPVSI